MTEWATEFPPTFDVGNPNGAHAHFDANGVTFYSDDGVTPVFTYVFGSGTVKFALAGSGVEIFADPSNSNLPTIKFLGTNAEWTLSTDGSGGTVLRLGPGSNVRIATGNGGMVIDDDGLGLFIPALRWGTVSVTFDGSGEATITHGCNGTPTSVIVTPGLSGTAYVCEAGNAGPNHFTVRMFNSATGAVAAGVGPFAVHWIAAV